MTRGRALALLAAVVAVGVVWLALSLRGSETQPGPTTAVSGDADVRKPLPPPVTRPGAATQPAADDDGNPALAPTDAPENGTQRFVDDQGRLAADHRGAGPPKEATRSAISGAQAAALRKQLRPEIDECVNTLTDPGAASGAAVSVTLLVTAESGTYKVAAPKVASRELAEQPFFACVEQRLDGLAVEAPDTQESADSVRLTFPYRVP